MKPKYSTTVASTRLKRSRVKTIMSYQTEFIDSQMVDLKLALCSGPRYCIISLLTVIGSLWDH
jgi:hypothetical protein